MDRVHPVGWGRAVRLARVLASEYVRTLVGEHCHVLEDELASARRAWHAWRGSRAGITRDLPEVNAEHRVRVKELERRLGLARRRATAARKRERKETIERLAYDIVRGRLALDEVRRAQAIVAERDRRLASEYR